jgi:hypothetical protein
MAEFQSYPQQIDMLVVYDINTQTSSQLAENFIAHTPKFDVIVVIGPFTHDNRLSSKEDHAVAIGDMASSIAQLENISCRVVYLPGEDDPPSTLIEQLSLTPNSVNCYARRVNLRDGVFLTGFTETGDNLEKRGVPDDFDRSEESDEELEDVEVKSGISSINIIKEILLCEEDKNEEDPESEVKKMRCSSPIPNQTDGEKDADITGGVFLFNYKFTHTLNHLLFHLKDALMNAKVNLCIIPPITQDALRLPATYGDMQILVPKSLVNGGNYSTVSMVKDEKFEWKAKVENFLL